MRTPALALTALLLSTTALAWTPTLDEATAKSVVDAAYRRGPMVPTSATVDLAVKEGAFASGANAVTAYAGGPTCVQTWLQKPTDFAAAGSRPSSITVVGQADYAMGAALAARDEFRNLAVPDAIEAARKSLPDGNLHVFVKIEGLAREELRDAYNVVTMGADGKVRRPYRVTFLRDWAAGPDGRWSGTMTYYFDLKGDAVKPDAQLPILFRTEADSDCAYRVDVNLASFR